VTAGGPPRSARGPAGFPTPCPRPVMVESVSRCSTDPTVCFRRARPPTCLPPVRLRSDRAWPVAAGQVRRVARPRRPNLTANVTLVSPRANKFAENLTFEACAGSAQFGGTSASGASPRHPRGRGFHRQRSGSGVEAEVGPFRGSRPVTHSTSCRAVWIAPCALSSDTCDPEPVS